MHEWEPKKKIRNAFSRFLNPSKKSAIPGMTFTLGTADTRAEVPLTLKSAFQTHTLPAVEWGQVNPNTLERRNVAYPAVSVISWQ